MPEPETATSIWFPGPRQVELRQEAVPPVGPRDVRIRARASAVSHGTEMLVFRGQVPAGLELDLPTLRGGFEFPIKYGYASVGCVEETGRDVSELTRGDLVFTHHPHQSAYVVPGSMPIRLPPDTPPESGVFLANIETAVNVVLDAAPRLGERVAIFGQGVVGLLIGQLVRRAGATEVSVVDPVAARGELAVALGADRSLTPAEAADALHDVDIAIEASGTPAALDLAVNSVAFGGTVIVCSWYGTKPVQLNLGGAFHRRRLRIVSSQVSTIDAALQPRWTHARRLELAGALLSSLQPERLISHRFAQADAAAAYRLVDTHPEQTVQVILTY